MSQSTRAAARLKLTIHIQNFGPLAECTREWESSNAVFGVYAPNGSGKTFISRAFRLLDPAGAGQSQAWLDNLIRDDSEEACLKFSISDGSKCRDAVVKLRRTQLPEVKRDENLIFHVFNYDYVRRNLEEAEYSPSGDIPGFVVGQANVNLQDERNRLSATRASIRQLNDAIEQRVSTARSELESVGVRRNLQEFGEVSAENVFNKQSTASESKYDDLLREIKDLEIIPEDLPPLGTSAEPPSGASIISEIVTLLDQPVSRADIASAVAAEIDRKRQFVELGLVHRSESGERCPFCKQVLKPTALTVIQVYEAYVEQGEAKAKSQCETIGAELDEWEKSLRHVRQESISLAQTALQRNSWLPESERVGLPEFPSVHPALDEAVTAIKMSLADKANDVSRTDLRIDEAAASIRDLHRAVVAATADLNDAASAINDKIDRSKTLVRDLRRKLCKAKMDEVRAASAREIVVLSELDIQERELQSQISRSEEAVRAPKRKLVAKSFADLIREFFGERFVFDPEAFVLSFQERPVGPRHDTVLSEGERRIVGFCFYLAEVHTKVDREEDYNKLFFVVDDPVSSLDYSHMYHIATKLRHPCDRVERLRLLVLSHSSGLQGLLSRQHVCELWFRIHNGSFKPISKGLVLPYDEHLSEVVRVAEGSQDPDFRTPNSIRHVLESIALFEDPDGSLDGWMETHDLSASFLGNLINDLSHGRPRLDDCHSHEEIVEACKEAVIQIRHSYPKQLTRART